MMAGPDNVPCPVGASNDGTSRQRRYWEDRLERNWGLHGVGSLAYGLQYNRWLYRVRRRAFSSIVRNLGVDLAQCRVLDVGCGTGFYLDLWREHGVRDLSGLDFSSVAVSRLRQQFPQADLIQADIADVPPPFAQERFDIIGAFDVLFHVVDDERYECALRNIVTMLVPGGYFLYSDAFPRRASLEYMDYWKARKLDDVKATLDRAGIDVIRRIPVFVVMNSPVDADSRVLRELWDIAMKAVRRSETVGFLTGAILYPFELLLRGLVHEGPSTEIMVCRKR